MASYGWTLEEALALTYPQVKALYRALNKWPTANLLAAGLMQAGEKKSGEAMDKLGGAKEGKVLKVDRDQMQKMLKELDG